MALLAPRSLEFVNSQRVALLFGLSAFFLSACGSDDSAPSQSEPAQNVGGSGLSAVSDEALECAPVTPLDMGVSTYENSADAKPFFSFFLTSQAGMYALPAGEIAPSPSPALGYGGNLGGLEGADEICTMLARGSNPGDTKTWRAFLSASGAVSGTAVDAIERIGEGPWYDYNGRLFALNIAGLLPNIEGRPSGSEPQLRQMFTDENGEDARPPGEDNHDTLTGSNKCGRLYNDGADGRIASCEGWTSSAVHGLEGDLGGVGGQIPVGHSWPRDSIFSSNPTAPGGHWMSDHTINGCEPGFDVDGGFGAPMGDFRVGAGGGFGGIYCFALGASAPLGG